MSEERGAELWVGPREFARICQGSTSHAVLSIPARFCSVRPTVEARSGGQGGDAEDGNRLRNRLGRGGALQGNGDERLGVIEEGDGAGGGGRSEGGGQVNEALGRGGDGIG